MLSDMTIFVFVQYLCKILLTFELWLEILSIKSPIIQTIDVNIHNIKTV